MAFATCILCPRHSVFSVCDKGDVKHSYLIGDTWLTVITSKHKLSSTQCVGTTFWTRGTVHTQTEGGVAKQQVCRQQQADPSGDGSKHVALQPCLCID